LATLGDGAFMENIENGQVKKAIGLSPAVFVLISGFIVSLITLVIYLEELNFSDETLFFLLSIIRYSSFLVCICAFYKILIHLYRFIRYRKGSIVKIIVYLFFLVYGIVIIFFEALIIVTAAGNV